LVHSSNGAYKHIVYYGKKAKVIGVPSFPNLICSEPGGKYKVSSILTRNAVESISWLLVYSIGCKRYI